MAKKEKVVLTPEELDAKRERTAEKRKIFGETFMKSLAVLLSVVLVYSIVYMAFGQGRKIIKQVAVTSSNTGSSSSSNGSSSSGSSNNSSSSSNGATSSDQGAAQDSSIDAEAVAKLINEATAKVANNKAGYKWTRDCKFTTPVDVGSATGILNKIIQAIDSNADLNSVVGGFLGVGQNELVIEKGQDAAAAIDYHGTNYAIKATSLKGGDLKNLKQNGDKYTFVLEDANTPKKDNSTSLSRFTNDIIVIEEVSTEIANFTSAVSVNSLEAVYKNINVEVEVKDGSLVSMKYSYDADAKLGLKAGLSINGTGAIHTDATYSNFVY